MQNQKITAGLEFFINLSKAKTVIARRFDHKLSLFGLGFSDFMIMFHLSQEPEGRMRRTDLAEKVGLTASGVTRMLIPMEKIGLVKRETDEHDARVSYVAMAPGGKRLYAEALERAEVLTEDIFAAMPSLQAALKGKKMDEFSGLLSDLGKVTLH